MQIPLVVVLWEHYNFVGRRRTIIQDTPNLYLQGFNDVVSSVVVHPGPNYDAWKAAHAGKEPTVGLYEHFYYGGAVLTLTVGEYRNIFALANFNDILSSIRFNPVPPIPGTFQPIRVVAEIFADPNFSGFRAVIVENVGHLQNYAGDLFNDAITSIKVYEGPNFQLGDQAHFYPHPDYQGGGIHLGPGIYPHIGAPPYLFDDVISSIKVLP